MGVCVRVCSCACVFGVSVFIEGASRLFCGYLSVEVDFYNAEILVYREFEKNFAEFIVEVVFDLAIDWSVRGYTLF